MSKYLIGGKLYECSFNEACDIALFDNNTTFFKRIGANNGWKYCSEKQRFISVYAPNDAF